MPIENGLKVQDVEAERRPRGALASKWDDRDAFSVEEAGEILGISRGSSYLAVKTGDLPVIRIGRRCIVSRAALERLFAI
jgi:excisionase family DNA binding protein